MEVVDSIGAIIELLKLNLGTSPSLGRPGPWNNRLIRKTLKMRPLGARNRLRRHMVRHVSLPPAE